MTLAEIKEALGGEGKPVYHIISESYGAPEFLKGKTHAQIAEKIKAEAKKAGLPSTATLDHRVVPVTKERSVYTRYKTYNPEGYRGGYYSRKVTTRNEGPYWVLCGSKPYTNEELLEKGEDLVKAKKKREAAAARRLAKKVADFNKKAEALGQPTITVEDVSV